ncbi:MAG TPA: glycosyltransferase family 39 protein [Anaerolineae bacterium]|nr:glycosyltransferase family 39 protein [Anaerolineae bacterium]
MNWGAHSWRPVIAFSAVALVLRLIPILLAADMGIALDDMFQYDALAESIRLGQGFTWYGGIPTAARAPLYPLFLAVVYSLFGHSFTAARVAQALVASLLPAVVYVLGRRMFSGRVGVAAAWAVAVYPMFLLYPLGLATENLFFLLVPLTVLCLVMAVDNSRPSYFLLSGLLLALTILTRSVIAVFVVFILPWLWCYGTPGRVAIKRWVLILLPVVALTLPWSIRNSLLYGRLAFVESSLGFNVYLGYHPQGTGTFDSPIAVDFLERIGAFEHPNLETEKAADELGLEEGLRFIREDPGRAAWLLLSKLSHFLRLDKRVLVYFYSNNFLGELSPWALAAIFLVLCLPWVVVLLLSVPGMVLSRLTKETMLIYLLFAYLVGVHVLTMAEPRFHLVMVPFLGIFAAQGAVLLRRMKRDYHAGAVQERRSVRWMVALIVLLVILLLVNWAYELHVDMEKLRILFAAGGNTARFTY